MLYLGVKKRKKTMKLVNLESVGNVIDENGVTYPMLADGGYDIFAGVHVNDIANDEFFDALSTEDWDVVDEYLDWDLDKYCEDNPDFDAAMNGHPDNIDYTGFDSFLENNLIA